MEIKFCTLLRINKQPSENYSEVQMPQNSCTRNGTCFLQGIYQNSKHFCHCHFGFSSEMCFSFPWKAAFVAHAVPHSSICWGRAETVDGPGWMVQAGSSWLIVPAGWSNVDVPGWMVWAGWSQLSGPGWIVPAGWSQLDGPGWMLWAGWTQLDGPTGWRMWGEPGWSRWCLPGAALSWFQLGYSYCLVSTQCSVLDSDCEWCW